MKSYDLKVGYECNNRCVHCVIDDSKNKLINKKRSYNLSTEKILDLIDHAVSSDCDNIVLTGGEVTIRKDFSILIKYCLDNNLSITIQTNGRNLSNENIVQSVKDVDRIRFVIALHGSNELTHDSITRVKGSFFETCKGIERMISLNKLVILKVVISKFNMYELVNIVRLADKLGVMYICFAFPHGQGAARINFDAVVPQYSQLKEILEDTINLASNCNIKVEFETIPFCIIPNHMKLVGELRYLLGQSFCTQVQEDTFDWNVIRNQIKSKTTNCEGCNLNELCEGVWSEYIEAFGGSELKPIILSDAVRDRLSNAVVHFKRNR